MLTNSSVTFTLELSNIDWRIFPNPSNPGTPSCGSPLAPVGKYKFCPTGSSPPRIDKIDGRDLA